MQETTPKTSTRSSTQIRDDIVRLAALVTEFIPRGTDVLLANDLRGAQALIEDDDELDALVARDRGALLPRARPAAADGERPALASSPPSGSPRRSSAPATSWSTWPRAPGASTAPSFDPRLRGLIERMSEEAARLFKLAIDAYVERNASLAAALDDMDDNLDQLHRDYIEAIFESHHPTTSDSQAAVQLALIGRYYERIGDHAVNIGQRVEYMVTGWLPEHSGAARPQGRSVADARTAPRPNDAASQRLTVGSAIRDRRWSSRSPSPPSVSAVGASSWLAAVDRRTTAQSAPRSEPTTRLAQAECRRTVATAAERCSTRPGLEQSRSTPLPAGCAHRRRRPARSSTATRSPRPSSPPATATPSSRPRSGELVDAALAGRADSRAARPVRPAPPLARDHRPRRLPSRPAHGALAVIDDITERRRLEAVRTDFVANISHELKTPVGASACWPRRSWPRTTPRSPTAWPSASSDRGRPGRPHHRGPARAQPHRDRRGVAAASRCPSTTSCWPRPSSASARPPSRPASISWSPSRARRARHARRPPPARLGALQPARQRGEVLRRRRRRSRSSATTDGRRGRDHRAPTTASASRPATSSGSSSASTGSTRPAAARPAAPASAWPSSATWSPTTTARSGRVPPRRGLHASPSRLPLTGPPAPPACRRRPSPGIVRPRPTRREAEPMTRATSVLVVEDEDSFIDALTVGLTREGFKVERRPRRRRGARHVRRRRSPTSCCST